MNQIEYIDIGGIDNLGKILEDCQATKVFLVTGKNSFTDCGTAEKINNLKGIKWVRFKDFETNPKIEEVNKGIQLFRQSEAEAIIAIGGGSVIDMAKLIRYFSMQNFTEIHASSFANYERKTIKNQPILIAVPITAGSGSEATNFAVMYIDKVKYSVVDTSILPDIVIIDPMLSMSLSPYNTAVSGMDTFCHAIESYWSINSTNESKEYAENAIKLVLDNLPKAVYSPTPQIRLNMAQASNLAGKAINISKTTAAHAISYVLTSYFAIPHGLAVSLIMPYFLIYNFAVTEEDVSDYRGVNYTKQTVSEINDLIGGKNSVDSKIKIERFIDSLGLPAHLTSCGVKIDDIELILNNVNAERLKNNPRKINKSQLKQMLKTLL